jgi:hypothetical protein
MKIHSICLVKNESDIIVQTLVAAAAWSDFIYIYDNGSTDGTWEKIVDLSRTVPQIAALRQDDMPYSKGLWLEPFNSLRTRSSAGDWWCKLDADEIYIDSPRQFLANVPEPFDVVWTASFQYYLTEIDIARFRQDPGFYADDVPVGQKCRYYCNNWSEIRFFRYSAKLQTGRGRHYPYPLTRAFPRRIRLKHFQYRSPQQIERRLATRRSAMNRGCFVHETRANWTRWILKDTARHRSNESRIPETWTERVLDSSNLVYDTGSDYVIAEELLPVILDPNSSLLRKMKTRLVRALIPRLKAARPSNANA